MRKEKARERQLQESAVITMLKAQVAQLEQKDRDKEEKIGKLQSEAALCQAESAQLRIEVKYLRETVDQLKKENLHLSSPEIIMPPTTEVKKST
jgi:regulator of replication initiation timing